MEKPDSAEGSKTEKKDNDSSDKNSETAQDSVSEEAATKQDSSNSNTEADTEKSDDLRKKVARQVEFYFGDYNMQRDKFLKEQFKLDEGWVPISTLLKFNKLKTLTTCGKLVASSVKKFGSDLLQVNLEEDKVRRVLGKPLPEYNDDYRRAQDQRTVYVKGVPRQVTQEQLEEFFSSHGKVEGIFMKRGKNKEFVGSAFVCFEDGDAAAKVVELPILKLRDNQVRRELQSKRSVRKAEEFQNRLAAKKRASDDAAGGDSKKLKTDEEVQYPNGCVLRLDFAGIEQPPFDTLKKCFPRDNPVAFVQFGKSGSFKNQKSPNKAATSETAEKDSKTEESKEGNGKETTGANEENPADDDSLVYLRFKEPGGAEKALPTIRIENSDKVKVGDFEIPGIVLTGEEELEYWKVLKQCKTAKHSDNKQKSGKRVGHWRNANQRRGGHKVGNGTSDD